MTAVRGDATARAGPRLHPGRLLPHAGTARGVPELGPNGQVPRLSARAGSSCSRKPATPAIITGRSYSTSDKYAWREAGAAMTDVCCAWWGRLIRNSHLKISARSRQSEEGHRRRSQSAATGTVHPRVSAKAIHATLITPIMSPTSSTCCCGFWIKNGPQVIVNFAAQGEGAVSWKNSWRFFETNSMALTRLTEELMKRDYLERFIQIGTSEMYGSVDHAATEDEPIKPSSPYAASKVAFDMYLESVHRFLKFPMNIIRPCNAYCPGQLAAPRDPQGDLVRAHRQQAAAARRRQGGEILHPRPRSRPRHSSRRGKGTARQSSTMPERQSRLRFAKSSSAAPRRSAFRSRSSAR